MKRSPRAYCPPRWTPVLAIAALFLRAGRLAANDSVPVDAKETGTLALVGDRGNQSAAYDWLNVILETSARDVDRVGARPTILARSMAISVTAMYDAWAAYDPKAVVEFMRDGPRSTGQSGHWLRFAQRVSRRDKTDLDTDVKLFFAVGLTAHDAFIACWDTKRHYDSSRPWSLVRYYYAGKKIKGWAGPGKGVVDLPAEEWHPYSPATFVTPPFPGYTSGHATVSGACAKMLELFTGSDRFNEVEERFAGSLTEPGFKCSQIQMVNGKLTVDQHATCEAVLKLPTFSEVAEMAALSRLMGGYHIRTDNEVGVVMGRKVSEHIWPKFKALFEGKPMPVASPMEVEKIRKMSMQVKGF